MRRNDVAAVLEIPRTTVVLEWGPLFSHNTRQLHLTCFRFNGIQSPRVEVDVHWRRRRFFLLIVVVVFLDVTHWLSYTHQQQQQQQQQHKQRRFRSSIETRFASSFFCFRIYSLGTGNKRMRSHTHTHTHTDRATISLRNQMAGATG